MNNAYQSPSRYEPAPGTVKFIAKRIRWMNVQHNFVRKLDFDRIDF
jgi:hypothetical protein